MAERKVENKPLWLIIAVEIAALALVFVLNEVSAAVDLEGVTLIVLIILVVAFNIGLFFYQRHRTRRRERYVPREDVYSDKCGDEPLDLARERLFVSTVLGTYFASLLESTVGYVSMPEQIQCQIPDQLKALGPFQSIVHRLNERQGVDAIVIAADAGMGKSTLAAKIIRCLYSRRDFDRILGDSAKSEVVELSSTKTRQEKPGFIDPASFYDRLVEQLGITEDLASKFRSVRFIRDSLAGTRALIVIDNLEDVEGSDKLLEAVKGIVGPDVKAIITTRKIIRTERDPGTLVVNLSPITDPDAVIRFTWWHIDSFAISDPRLGDLRSSLNRARAKLLVQKSGGVPLVIQLLLSDVVNKSWAYLDQVPHIELSQELLEYLYGRRWQELQQAGEDGALALNVLRYIADRQECRERTHYKDLSERFGQTPVLGRSIELLRQYFLLVIRPASSEFVIYPVLLRFIRRKESTPAGNT